MKRSTRILLTAVAVIAAVICILCCLIIFQYLRGAQVNETVEELNVAEEEHVQIIPIVPEVPYPSRTPEVEEKEYHQPDWYIHVNFEALKEINSDIYAWVDIPGTPVSYAVVQSPTNDLFYNNHAVDKSYYTGGSIFSQRYNSLDFQEPMTVLYGHNRESKTMFAPLNDFARGEVFDQYPYVYIYTPEKVYRYEIFAAYPHSSEHLLLAHDFSDGGQFEAFFAGLDEGIDTHFRRELFPEVGDKVLTLSTCYKSNRMQRYLVQGVLTMEYTIIHED